MDPEHRPLSPDQEKQYREYVWGKFRKNLNARDRADWQRIAGRFQHWRAVGNQFRDGIAIICGYTEECGWEKEVYFKNRELGGRFHDTAHHRDLRAHEMKYGRVGREALAQLAKDARALRFGWTVEWHLRDLSLVHRDVLVKMQKLARKFPDQFEFREVPAQEAERAMDIGRNIARAIEQGKTRETAEREAAERYQASQLDRAVEHEIDNLRPVLDRVPDLDARGNLLNTLESAALLQLGKETTRLALARLQTEHRVMREMTQERANPEQQPRGPTPPELGPERVDLEQDSPNKELSPLEFDSVERRTALAMHLAELGVEPELIAVRMLCELAQAQPPVEAARMPVEGPIPMRPRHDDPHLERDRNRRQERGR